MSDALVWQCVKNFNSFQRKRGCTVKRGGVTLLSAEPGNLASISSFKHSGLANSRVVDFAVAGEGKDIKIVMTKKVSWFGETLSGGQLWDSCDRG